MNRSKLAAAVLAAAAIVAPTAAAKGGANDAPDLVYAQGVITRIQASPGVVTITGQTVPRFVTEQPHPIVLTCAMNPLVAAANAQAFPVGTVVSFASCVSSHGSLTLNVLRVA